MALHETDLAFNRWALRFVNHIDILGLDDADILALTTVDGLVSAMANTAEHETNQNIIRHGQEAMQGAQDVAALTDAEVAAADTVAGLKAVFTGKDSNLRASGRSSFAWSPR